MQGEGYEACRWADDKPIVRQLLLGDQDPDHRDPLESSSAVEQ